MPRCNIVEPTSVVVSKSILMVESIDVNEDLLTSILGKICILIGRETRLETIRHFPRLDVSSSSFSFASDRISFLYTTVNAST